MSDKTELLPCPFCGSTNLVKSPWIECDNCGAMGPSPRDCDNYSGEWNRRASIAQQAAPAVPAGWKLVPVEPTDDQLVAGQEEWVRGRRGALEDCMEANAIYAAMLAAAPEYTAQEGRSHE